MRVGMMTTGAWMRARIRRVRTSYRVAMVRMPSEVKRWRTRGRVVAARTAPRPRDPLRMP
jgi:hypothetical protein